MLFSIELHWYSDMEGGYIETIFTQKGTRRVLEFKVYVKSRWTNYRYNNVTNVQMSVSFRWAMERWQSRRRYTHMPPRVFLHNNASIRTHGLSDLKTMGKMKLVGKRRTLHISWSWWIRGRRKSSKQSPIKTSSSKAQMYTGILAKKWGSEHLPPGWRRSCK